jgi:hypothetical protein
MDEAHEAGPVVLELVDSKALGAGELKSFKFADFVLRFRNHPYVVPVKGLRLTLDPIGIWSATYKLEKSQWRAGVRIDVTLLREGKPVTLEPVHADFPLACHIAIKVTGGAFPEGLFGLIDGVTVSVGGTGASVC